MSEAIERKIELKRDDAKTIEAGEKEEKPQDEEKKKKNRAISSIVIKYEFALTNCLTTDSFTFSVFNPYFKLTWLKIDKNKKSRVKIT